MRWWTFIILAVGALTLQASLAPRLELWGARPDWLLILCVFLGLHARQRDAIGAAWLIGLCADLMSIERIGLMAISFAIITWLVATVRDYLFRHHALTQFVVTFAASAIVQIGWLAYRRTLYSFEESWAIDLLRSVTIAPFYTALLAPIVHRCLLFLGPMLGLPKPKYSFAGTQSAGEPLV